MDVWKQSHALTISVYQLTQLFPKEERYGVIDQLRRTASSVSANIAEGFGRYHFKDKQRFYYTARASAAEVQNFIWLSTDLDYVTKEIAREVFRKTTDVKKLINGLIRSIEKQKTSP